VAIEKDVGRPESANDGAGAQFDDGSIILDVFVGAMF
jgi:hypothetical protein